jgi:GNAT superfamily N-acetyltransferase
MAVDVPGFTFEHGEREGFPWADVVAVDDDDVAEAEIWSHFEGWMVSVPVRLGLRLIARGASLRRHAHCMTFRLAGWDPPSGWAEPVLGPGLVARSWAHDAADILSSWRLAYPPGHPDHIHGDDAHVIAEDLSPLIAGSVIGPVMACSGVVERDGFVVAACIVNDREGQPPMGGPWIGDVFRRPGADYAGLGATLIRRALALAGAAGLPAVGLAVSEGNPARQVYARLGFELTDSSISVLVPTVLSS